MSLNCVSLVVLKQHLVFSADQPLLKKTCFVLFISFELCRLVA